MTDMPVVTQRFYHARFHPSLTKNADGWNVRAEMFVALNLNGKPNHVHRDVTVRAVEWDICYCFESRPPIKLGGYDDAPKAF